MSESGKRKKNIVPISCVYVDNSMLGKTHSKYVKKPIIIYFEQMLSTVDVTSRTPDGHKLVRVGNSLWSDHQDF